MGKVSAGRVGRYEIMAILGRGPVCELLLAQDDTLRRQVIIKRLTEASSSRDLARFQLEVKSATFRHPNIPVVYEVGMHEDLPFIAMEFVEGETLKSIIESRRELDLVAKLRIIEQVCTALGYAHRNEIVYGDVMPENVIVQSNGVVKIIDFGVARIHDADVAPSPASVSTDTGLDNDIGGRDDGPLDAFPVGLMLLNLLTGRDLSTGAHPLVSFETIGDVRGSLAAALHDYPAALVEIIGKSLAKDLAAGYKTCEEFADALHGVIDELIRTRIAKVVEDAKELMGQGRFDSALELLDEAVKLAPSNKPARKLRKSARERQEQVRRAARILECLHRSDAALSVRKFDESLAALKEAQTLDPESDDIKLRIQSVKEKRCGFENGLRALADAERAKALGDIADAFRIANGALREDPENENLLALRAGLAGQMEMTSQRERVDELVEKSERALAAGDYDAADTLLNELVEIGPSNPRADKLRQELAEYRELEHRQTVLERTRLDVQDCIKSDAYDQAFALISQSLAQYPDELLLHRLKAEVEAGERMYDFTRVVDMVIARAKELFTNSPLKAIAVLEEALDNMPSEARLAECMRALRQQMDGRRSRSYATTRVSKCRS